MVRLYFCSLHRCHNDVDHTSKQIKTENVGMTKNEDAAQRTLNDTLWVVKQSAPFHTLRSLFDATNMGRVTKSMIYF